MRYALGSASSQPEFYAKQGERMTRKLDAFKQGASLGVSNLPMTQRDGKGSVTRRGELLLHVVVMIPGFLILNRFGYVAGLLSMVVMILLVALAFRLTQRGN